MLRNGNSKSARLHREHHKKLLEQCLFLFFLDNMAVVLGLFDNAG
jgi:hypothetical protein